MAVEDALLPPDPDSADRILQSVMVARRWIRWALRICRCYGWRTERA